MPDEVHSLMLSGKRDHADRIENAAAQDQDEHPDIVFDHARDEQKSAPADQEIERKVKRHEPGRAENANKSDPRDDQGPLDAEHDDALGVAPVHEAERGEGAADQKIDRTVVEASPEFLDEEAAFPGVVKTAHREKEDQADSVKAGCHDLE